VDEVVKTGAPLDLADVDARTAASFTAFSLAALPRPRDRSWEGLAQHHYRTSLGRRADALALDTNRDQRPENLRRAAAQLEQLLTTHPEAATSPRWRNLGALHQRLLPSDPAARPAMVRAWKRYLAGADPKDPYLAPIRAALGESGAVQP
jgi:hypothetical protein